MVAVICRYLRVLEGYLPHSKQSLVYNNTALCFVYIDSFLIPGIIPACTNNPNFWLALLVGYITATP